MVTVQFYVEKDEQSYCYGPYEAVELLINEIWPIFDGEPGEQLAEYDTHEGPWHVFGQEGLRFNVVRIEAIEGRQPL